MTPPDPYVLEGTPLVLNCTIGDGYDGNKDSSSLYFHGSKVLSDEEMME